MENASKALIMAGAVLIAIMILSLGILLFSRLGGSAKEMADMDEQEISAFNSKIKPYLGESVAGSQVNALLQYCLSVNIAAKNSGETYKQITITDESGAVEYLKPGETKFKKVTTNNKYYEVTGTYNENGLLTKIYIK